MNDSIVREIIAQLLGFALFFWILKTFAWKPILKLLDDRRSRIQNGLRDIENGRKEISNLQKDYEGRLTKIEDEARVKIQEAVSEGKKIAQEICEKAREDANQILAKAKENIDLEIFKAQLDLRMKIVDLALGAAEHVIKREMNESSQREAVKDFIEELSGERKP